MAELAILSRFVHFTAAIFLFGTSLFPFYANPDDLKNNVQRAKFNCWLNRVLCIAAVALLLSALAWWISLAATMSGEWKGALDPETLQSVLFDTSFGEIWQARIFLNVAAIFLLCLPLHANRYARTAVLILAILLLISLGAVGHGAMFSGVTETAHRTGQAIHLLAAGFWIGGLLPLAYTIHHALRSSSRAWSIFTANSLKTFSRLGYFAVALIFLTGSFASVLMIQKWAFLFHSLYGTVLLAKICLFGLICCLALLNRTVLLPRLFSSREPSALGQLLRTVVIEQSLGIGILLIVSVLGTLAPPLAG